MKLETKKIFSFSLIACLLAFYPVLAFVSATYALPHKTVVNSVSQPVVVVDVYKTAQQVIPSGQTQSSIKTSCQAGYVLEQNLIQNTGAVNLFQPANCLSLSEAVSRPFVKVVALKVLPALHTYVNLVVLDHTGEISSRWQMPKTASIPINLVLLVAVVYGLMNYFAAGNSKTTLILVKNPFKLNKNIFELQMMRC
jgi:hypothetical protein